MTNAIEVPKVPVCPAPALTYWDGMSEDSLAQALSLPATECMEVALIDGNQYGRLLFRPRSARCLRLALTTRSAYRLQVVRVFVAALAVRVKLSRDLGERIHTAIQEAMINSVMHGNLALSSELRDSLEGLTASHQNIERLLGLPEIARSMIRVDAVWNASVLYVLVRDSGAGFEKSELPSPQEWKAAGHHGSGRGLAIVEAFCESVALSHGGSTIKLGFRL